MEFNPPKQNLSKTQKFFIGPKCNAIKAITYIMFYTSGLEQLNSIKFGFDNFWLETLYLMWFWSENIVENDFQNGVMLF